MCQAVNHAQVVHFITGRIVLVCGLETTIITVEDSASGLTFLELAGHFAAALPHRHRSLRLDHLPQFSGLPSALQLRRRAHENRLGVFRLGAAWIEYLEGFVAEVFIIAFAQIVDSNQEGVVHDLEFLQKFNVFLELLDKQLLLLQS